MVLNTRLPSKDSTRSRLPWRNLTEDMEKEAEVEDNQPYKSSTDTNQVDWEGPDDVHNPRNWSVWKRGMIVGIVTSIVFSTCLASSAIAPAVPQVLEEFGVDKPELGTLVVTIELMGTAVGPLVLAPISEIRGRRIVYNIANLCFCLFSAGCALTPNIGGLVVMRFLQGCAASCSVNNAGGTIADIVPMHRRGAVMSFFSMGFLFGPVIGPIIGSYLAVAMGWRWIFWLLLIFNFTLGSICTVVCPETYEFVLLKQKAKRLRRETGNSALYARGQRQQSVGAMLGRASIRPLKMLLLCPLITGLSLYIAAVYGFTYLLLATFSVVFEEQYHYCGGRLGLVYLGLAGGMLLSVGLASVVSDRTFVRLSKKYHEEKPEYHLEALIYGAIAIPIGLFMYGWTAEKRLHSAIPIAATGFMGFGVMFTFIPIQVYMTIAYTKYAASAIAASSVLRSIAGALIPMAGIPLYDRLGLGWGSSLLAFISLGLGGLSLLLCRYGEILRKTFPIELD